MKKYGAHQIDENRAANVAKKALLLSEPIASDRLGGGYTEAPIFKVISDSKKYVVRFLEHIPKEMRIKEIKNLKIASQKGCGPHIYFADPDQAVVIMEFLLNKEITKENSQSQYTYLAKLLQKIHSGEKFEGYINVFADLKKYIKVVMEYLEIKNIGGIPLVKIEGIINILYDLFASLDTAVVPCHNDLHPGNLFFLGDKFKAIDYEYSAQGNPFYDLAEISIFYCTSVAQEEILLLKYFERQPLAKEKAELYLMKQVAWVFYAVFFLEQNQEQLHKYEKLQIPLDIDLVKEMAEGNGISGDKENMLMYAKFLFNHVVANSESQEFRDAVELLGGTLY